MNPFLQGNNLLADATRTPDNTKGTQTRNEFRSAGQQFACRCYHSVA